MHGSLIHRLEPRIDRGPRYLQSTFFVVALSLLVTGVISAQAGDNRQVYSFGHQSWLLAVGKLQVPTQRHEQGRTRYYLEDCSATLVASDGSTKAGIIVTAWHCLEFYRDLSRPIVFSTNTRSGATLTREAIRLADGGGMHADWAVLALSRAIPAELVPNLSVTTHRPDPAHPVIMAGYSGDSGLGRLGAVLTFDPACAIVSQHLSHGTTNCTAYKGASGGALIQHVRGERKPSMYGVISQGNSEGTSTYTPLATFRSTIMRYLNQSTKRSNVAVR